MSSPTESSSTVILPMLCTISTASALYTQMYGLTMSFLTTRAWPFFVILALPALAVNQAWFSRVSRFQLMAPRRLCPRRQICSLWLRLYFTRNTEMVQHLILIGAQTSHCPEITPPLPESMDLLKDQVKKWRLNREKGFGKTSSPSKTIDSPFSATNKT